MSQKIILALTIFLFAKVLMVSFLPELPRCGEDCRATKVYFETKQFPSFIKSPGYTAFSFVGQSLFGYGTDQARFFLVFLQILASLGSLIFIFLIGKKLFDENIGFFAAILLASDPLTQSFSLLLHTETLFLFFFLGALYWAVNFFQNFPDQKKSAFYFGLFLAVATLFRPVGYFLMIPTVGGMLLAGWRLQSSFKLLFKSISLFLLPIILLVGGWQIRNGITTGSFEFSYIKSDNLFHYRAPMTLMQVHQIGFEEARDKMRAELPPDFSEKTQTEKFQIYEQLSWPVILGNFGHYLKASSMGGVRMLFGGGQMSTASLLGKNQEVIQSQKERSFFAHFLWLAKTHFNLFFLQVFSWVHLGGVYFLFGIGIWKFFQKPLSPLLPHLFLGGVVLYFLGISGPEGYSRFRIPFYPIFILYASFGLTNWIGGLSLRNPRSQDRA